MGGIYALDEITTEVRLQQWSSAIAECNNSGMTKKEWCRQNGMSLKTFYYRQRKVRQATYSRMSAEEGGAQFADLTPKMLTTPSEVTVAKLPRTRKAPAVLCVGKLRIELNESISDAMLKQVIAAVQDVT